MRHLTALILCMLAASTIRAAETPAPTAAEDSFDLRQVLLRQSSVTVAPGQWQWDLGLDYARAPVSLPDGGRIVDRTFSLINNLRVGLSDRIEVFAGIPLSSSKRETTDATGFHSDSVSGPGDLVAGASAVLAHEGASWPAMTATFAASFPTGESPYDREQLYGASTGSGHTALRGELNFVRSSDPLVFYWGAGYEYFDSASGWGSDIQPGGAILYRLGMGFEVNRDASLVTEVGGAYQFDQEIDGKKVSGSESEPVALTLGVTKRISTGLYIEPSVSFGMTDDAPDMVAGVTLINRGMF